MIKIFLSMFVAYLLGNISGGLILGKLFFNKDIRDYGSKNAGTTNALRVLEQSRSFDVCNRFF